MKYALVGAIVGAWLVCVPLGANAAPSARVLSDAEWRADIGEVVQTIATRHPRPFAKVKEAEFRAMAAGLVDDVPKLSDHQVQVRLAQLVARIQDGHTRISIPRQHPNLGVLQGHIGTAPPKHDALNFADLPVRFELFDDGVFIVGATPGHERLIGAQVLKVCQRPVMEAVSTVRSTIAADNESGARLIVPDRLSMPELLQILGVCDRSDAMPLTVRLRTGEEATVGLQTLGAESVPLKMFDGAGSAVFGQTATGEAKSWQILRNRSALIVRIREIEEFPDEPLSDFWHSALNAARRAGIGRIILDIRHNQGGSAQFNPAIVRALLASDYNHFGRLYVLIGRQTFSAAQMLVNELEQYAEAMFVGEATGSGPSHFGDPVRTVLKNSGLTLRTSTIEWRSWLAGEFRTETQPHLDAPYLGSDFFSGRDAALDAALGFEPQKTVARQVEQLFRTKKTQAAILRFITHFADPTRAKREAPASFVDRGKALIADGFAREGYFMMVLVSDYFPNKAEAHLGLAEVLEQRGEIDAARRRYERVLKIDPGNAAAKAALERLSAKAGK